MQEKASDKIKRLRESVSPSKFAEIIASPNLESAELFRESINELRENCEKHRAKHSLVSKQIDWALNFYQDLIKDGLIAVNEDFATTPPAIEMYQVAQARDTMRSYSTDLKSENPRTSLLAMTKIYGVNYEDIFKEILRPLASKIEKKRIRRNSKALQIISSYKEEKHKLLFAV